MAKQPNRTLYSNHLRLITLAMRPLHGGGVEYRKVPAYVLRGGLGASGVWPEADGIVWDSRHFAVHRRVHPTLRLEHGVWDVTFLPNGMRVTMIWDRCKTPAEAIYRAAHLIEQAGPETFSASLRRTREAGRYPVGGINRDVLYGERGLALTPVQLAGEPITERVAA